jgi:hypothetical protein
VTKLTRGRKSFNGAEMHPTEVFFWLRGQDVLAPPALQAYANACRSAAAALVELGTPEAVVRAGELREFATDVSHVAAEMIQWQAEHPELVGLPD